VNLSADRRTLSEALGLLSVLAGKKFPCNCAHLVATRGDADELTLTATDGLDVLSVTVEAEVKAEGRLITPLAALLALVQAESGPSLTLKADRGFLKVLGGSVRGSVATGDPEAYPTLFEPPAAGWVEFPRAPIWEAIERAMPLSGTDHGESSQWLDGVNLRGSAESAEVFSWHGWRATLEAVPIDASGVDFEATVTHGNWRVLQKFDLPTIELLRTSTHHLWRQEGMLLTCRRSERESNWPARDHAGIVLLRQPAENGLAVAENEASTILGAEKAILQCAGVPLVIEWDGKELLLSRENDVNSAALRLPLGSEVEPWTFKTKDVPGVFGLLGLAAKSKQPAVLSPWEHGLRVTIGQLTASLAPYG
jgi:hypothetical protein